MPKKIQNCTKAHLVSVPLPNHGATYTVISHQSVMDYVYTELAAAGFSVVREEYRCTADGQIAHGIYKLNFNNDPELSMMFAWTNSYNKQVRFKCGVGAYINLTGTTMVCGDMGSWARKHTGTADEETINLSSHEVELANINELVQEITKAEKSLASFNASLIASLSNEIMISLTPLKNIFWTNSFDGNLPNKGIAFLLIVIASNTPSHNIIGSFQFTWESKHITFLLIGGFLYFILLSG